MVTRTKEYIRAGDIVQAVLSQRGGNTIHTTPFQLYGMLRVVNPSPICIICAWPASMVGLVARDAGRCEDGQFPAPLRARAAAEDAG